MIYAGRLAEVKGLHLLMTAWDCYRRIAGGPGVRLVIAGAGPLRDEVAAWASSRPSVEMTGEVDSSRCSELIAAARAIIVPSAWEETFGLVVVEAMAMGTPAIAAGHGSLAELISPGVDGVLFQPGDPVALALAETSKHIQSSTKRSAIRPARHTSNGLTPSLVSSICLTSTASPSPTRHGGRQSRSPVSAAASRRPWPEPGRQLGKELNHRPGRRLDLLGGVVTCRNENPASPGQFPGGPGSGAAIAHDGRGAL